MDNTNYLHVRFGIRSGYEWGKGMPESAMNEFENDIEQIFKNIGYDIKNGGNGACNRAIKGINNIYMHPMELTGVVEEQELPIIREAIKNSSTFTVYQERILSNTVKNWNDEEIAEYLNGNREKYKAEMLNNLVTKRRNLFVPCGESYGISWNLASKYKVKTPDRLYGMSSSDIEVSYFFDMLQELVSEGKVIKAATNRGDGYRTAKADELKHA